MNEANDIDAIAYRLSVLCHDTAGDPGLYRTYAVLALTVGADVTREQVHDAWSSWRSASQPNHRSLVPFDQLPAEAQVLDDPHVKAIRDVALNVAKKETA